MSSDVAAYLESLRAHLRLDGNAESDVMRELADHLEDRIEELTRRGMPVGVARRQALRGFGRPQTFAHLVRQAQLTTPWREAAVGASCFVLLAAVVALQAWQPLLAAAGAAIVVAMTVYGLWLGRPAWFYPWAGVALSLPIVAGYIAFAVLHRAATTGHMDALSLAGIVGAALYFPVGLVVVTLAVSVAVRRDWLDASVLLSPLPGVFVLIQAVHRAGGFTSGATPLPETASLLSGVYLCMAVAMFVFLRATVRSVRVLTIIGTAVLLVSASSLLIDPAGGAIALAMRMVLLIGFLLSPALVARHA